MGTKNATFAHRIEYGAVLFIEGLFRIMPYAFCVGFACALSRFAFHILRWRRREAVRRIKSVFGDAVTDTEANRIAYQSLRNSALIVAEIMYGRTLRESWIEKHVSGHMDCVKLFKSLTDSGHGVVLALPHFGNWYLAGSIVAHYGTPLFAVAGAQHNPLTNDWMNRKLYTGMTVFERGSSAIRQCVKSLRSQGVLAILPDVRMKQPDLTVRFLGGDANLGRGMASFARKTNSPIVLARLRRNGLTHHEIRVAEPIFPDPSLDDATDIRRMTETVMSSIEAQIRANPGQWFWYNRRWVLDPLT